ncbi:hypothetical protein XELAEV_18042843mg [Xenopus laevis]|uniref:Uncharacterized protein n=1 Tax=Xenopus laevis TaxID=8355 RepID=A0A974H6R7_XENLA|nr:hypothetical protein XELAEV_18042843mg [Xenopus laevis]
MNAIPTLTTTHYLSAFLKGYKHGAPHRVFYVKSSIYLIHLKFNTKERHAYIEASCLTCFVALRLLFHKLFENV